ncbi:MAG: V-type ATP synthase subunit F [Clostridia bacterium]|nr:V-type ATP synthase subunit F [Clostridia bacterium]
MSEKNRIGVIGRRSDVLPFQAAGFTTFQAESVPEAAEKLKKAAEECAIVFLTPEYAAALQEETVRYDAMMTPAVIALPEKGGGVGMTMLRQAAERAVGSDILFREEA